MKSILCDNKNIDLRNLNKEQAEYIYEQGKEAVIFALLQLAQLTGGPKKKNLQCDIAEHPSTPSAQKPVFAKENLADKKQAKKPGRKVGHEGACREIPQNIDVKIEHSAPVCPDCGGELNRRLNKRSRIIEDLSPESKIEVTEHIINRDFCPNCRKFVEPRVTSVLPKSTIGNGILAFSAWLHYALGNTISQICSVLNYHLSFTLSKGGLVQMWQRLAVILEKWFCEIIEDIQQKGALHGDETGWRVNGKTNWLWCFTSDDSTIFSIEESRGHEVILKYLKDNFNGILISDFWPAYNLLKSKKQKCLVHLLRELEKVDKYKPCNENWNEFAKKLRKVVFDAINLYKEDKENEVENYGSYVQKIKDELRGIIQTEWSHKEAKRLIKRLKRHENELFTFLEYENVPFENNFGERSIRGAVIMRKNSFNNRSKKGAATQSILMSVLYTIKQRNLNPIETIKDALAKYIETGTLPNLSEYKAENQ